MHPIGQILGNHQDSSARTVSNFPVSRKYTPGEGQPPAQSAPSPAAPSGSIPFDTSFAVGAENTALFGLEYIPEESYTGFIEYNLVNTDADRTVYTARQQVTLVAGTNYTQWFRSPASSRAGANVRGRLFKDDRTILNVRSRTDDANLPFTNSHLRRYEDEVVLTQSSAASAHPVTLRQDMPSEEDAQALADASLDDNSALWIVSADQAAAANRAGATIQAERSGMLDLNGDEIPTTATAANTLQLRVGTVLKIMAANEYRVLSSPLYNTDVTDNSAVEIQQNGVQVVAAAAVINFVGNGVTVTEVGGVATVTITGTVNPPQASHSNFIALTADNLAATVDTAAAIVSDDLNPTVTLPTFTGNRYIQILQSQAHTAFTSIVISGINQFGAFTVTENARTIDGQAYRQYVTTNLITDAVSGQTLTMSGAN